MEFTNILTILLYILGSAGYIVYFFAQREYLHKTGFCLMVSGFFFHTITIGWWLLTSKNLPVYSLHETLSILSWSAAGVFIILQNKYKLKILGSYAAPFAAIILIASVMLPCTPVTTNSLFNSFWVVVHVIAVFIGYASLALACGTGLLYLMQENAIKAKKRGFFYKRLPSLDLLDTTGYACLVAGFTMLTAGLILGIIYAKLIGGRFWSWTPKEVWSAITWLVYAALLHQRLTVGWRGRRAAIMAIVGFVVMIFTFFGVNFFLEEHHGEFFQVIGK